MSKIFSKISLGLLAAAALAWPAGAAPLMKALTGHVPKIVSQLSPTGSLAETNQLHLAIGLPLRNQDGLNALLAQINDPASPNYRHYLTPAEFTAQFGPTKQDYQTVLDYARTNGLKVVRTHDDRMLVDVEASTPSIEQAFHVHMRTYHHPSEARDFYSPDTEPTVESRVPILSIQGMNNYVLPKSMMTKRPSGAVKGNGSGPFGGYMGQDFRSAYVPGTTLNGSGQVVGLLQFDGYYPSDIATYETIAGLTNVPLQNVLLDGFNGAPGVDNDEVCLDIEMSMAMAPALSSIVVFEAGPFGNPDDILSTMAASNQIKQLSSSWGYTADAASEQYYQQFALQGQTYLNCSGDGDAWVGPIPYGSCESPNATIVGGTTLTMSGQAVAYISEKAWNYGFADDYNWNPDGFAGTSGGISTDVALPSWQKGINMVTNQGSATFRNVPDVALTADNVFLVSSGGQEGLEGGTSCATPLWAGFMALANQQAVQSSLPSIGFLAPKAYALAATVNYTNYFHDTTAGNNYWDQSLTNFPAVPGYDLCTGLGTPNGTNLISALAGFSTNTAVGGSNIIIISAPVAPWGATLSTMIGGNPNGDWLLFIQDDGTLDSGMIDSGWYVTLTTGDMIGYPADNGLCVSTNSVLVPPGSNFSLTLAVTNYGPATFCTNVEVADLLPTNGVTLVSSNATIGSVSLSGLKLVWSGGGLTNLAANTGGTLTLNFTANTIGTYLNSPTVNASTSNPDPNPDDDAAPTTILVAVPAPPVLTVTASPSGQQLVFSVTDSVAYPVVIQASTNLVTWVSIYTNTTMPTSFSYTNATAGFPYRFFRAFSP